MNQLSYSPVESIHTEMLASEFDAVVMLTASNWKKEPRSNRFHYATRFSRHLPVFFVEPQRVPSWRTVEKIDNFDIRLVRHTPKQDKPVALEAILADFDVRRPLIWVYNSAFEDFIRRNRHQFIVYHATEQDFLAETRVRPPRSPEFFQQIRNVLAQADLLVTVTDEIRAAYEAEDGGQFKGRSLSLTNGCDFGFWRAHNASDFVKPEGGRPVAFYQGGINLRLDIDLILKVVERMPDWDFWFAGRVVFHDQKDILAWLEVLGRPNVSHLGELSPEGLADASRRASIGIIPFIDEPLMRLSLPLKAYEYVACGLPVVSTPITTLQSRPELFAIASDAEEFASAIRRLRSSRTNPRALARRTAAAAAESYDRKFDELTRVLAECVPQSKHRSTPANVLMLYNDQATHIGTVLEYIEAFREYSRHKVSYMPCTGRFPGLNENNIEANWDFSVFDAILIHYSVRLPVENHFHPAIALAVRNSPAVKVLFIQDEYNYTELTRSQIQYLRLDAVFTCVPSDGVEYVYPKRLFPRTEFIQTLTGFVSERADLDSFRLPMAERHVRIAYRARDLPHFYGALGHQKVTIGLEVKKRAEAHGIPIDIEVDTNSRLYMDNWWRFLGSARAMLGTESGSNIFDIDGTLKVLGQAMGDRPYDEVYERYLASREGPVRMNQISPKIFEAIQMRTALVLFEGDYSGVVKPGEHFIPLKHDYSNLDDIFAMLEDAPFLERLTERAYADVIAPGRYTYKCFIDSVDAVIDQYLRRPRAGMPKPGQAPGHPAVAGPYTSLLGEKVLQADVKAKIVAAITAKEKEAQERLKAAEAAAAKAAALSAAPLRAAEAAKAPSGGLLSSSAKPSVAAPAESRKRLFDPPLRKIPARIMRRMLRRPPPSIP